MPRPVKEIQATAKLGEIEFGPPVNFFLHLVFIFSGSMKAILVGNGYFCISTKIQFKLKISYPIIIYKIYNIKANLS